MRPRTRTKPATAGAAPGSIIAAIIGTQAATKNASEPSSVAAPMSIPLIWRTARAQHAAARASVAATAAAGFRVSVVVITGDRRVGAQKLIALLLDRAADLPQVLAEGVSGIRGA